MANSSSPRLPAFDGLAISLKDNPGMVKGTANSGLIGSSHGRWTALTLRSVNRYHFNLRGSSLIFCPPAEKSCGR